MKCNIIKTGNHFGPDRSEHYTLVSLCKVTVIIRVSGCLDDKRVADLSSGVKTNSAEVYISFPTPPIILSCLLVHGHRPIHTAGVLLDGCQRARCVNVYGCLVTQSEHI